MNPLKKLAGETALYGLSSIVGRTLNYLLIPIYTAYFLPSEMGVYTKLYSFVAFLNVVYTFGMETAYFRFASKEGASEPKIFNNTVSIIITISLLLSGLFISFPAIFSKLTGDGVKTEYIIILALILGIDALVAIPFAKLRLEKKAAYFALVKMLNIGFNIGFNLFFIVLCPLVNNEFLSFLLPITNTVYNPSIGIGYIFLSNLLSNALLLPFFIKTFLNFRLSFEKVATLELVIYAFPLMLMGLTGMVNEVIDRIVLEYWLPPNFYAGISNLDAIGIYGSVYKISIFMSLAIQAFKYAADPFFFSKAQDKNSPELFAKVTKWFLYTCLVLFIGVSLNLNLLANEILRNKIYHQGLYVVPLLLLANLFLGMYYNFSIWYKLTDKTYYGTYISVIGAVLTVVLNFVLIPKFGYEGSAWATLICYFVMAVLCVAFGQKYFYVPYPFFNFLVFILLAIGIVYIKPFWGIENSLMSFIYSIFSIITFIGLILASEKLIVKKI